MAEGGAEEAWMAAYAKGDRRAFERLFAALAPRIYAFFMRSFKNPAVAEDLLQMTFLNLHRARAQYEPGRPVRPWLFAIAARVRLDELRKRYRLPEQAGEDALDRLDDPADPLPDGRIAHAESRAEVQAALDRLPEGQRVVVHLHHFEGLSFGEIAEVLGTTEGAAKLRAFRGYERLRRELGGLLSTAEGT